MYARRHVTSGSADRGGGRGSGHRSGIRWLVRLTSRDGIAAIGRIACFFLAAAFFLPSAVAQPAAGFVPAGGSVTLKSLDLSAAGLCDMVHCQLPPLGGKPVQALQHGTTLFFPFTRMQLRHPAGSFFFRPGDWKLFVGTVANRPPPVELGFFLEHHIERGSGVIGDEADEGVALYFPWDADAWKIAQAEPFDLTISNLTAGTVRERGYDFIGPGRGSLPLSQLCPNAEGDPRIDLIVQRDPTGLSPTPFHGAVDEIVVTVAEGTRGRATFHVAIVSTLPLDSTGVQVWVVQGSVVGDVRVVEVTSAGTAAEGAPVDVFYSTPPDWLHPDTGLPQGEGFWALAVTDAREGAVRPLPPRGTATVLSVTVETNDELCAGCEVVGELVWRDNLRGADLSSGRHNQPVETHFSVNGRSHYPCTCSGARLVFRSPGVRGSTIAPGKELRLPAVEPSRLSSICELIDCPDPPFGKLDALAEYGFSFLVPFFDIGLRHNTGTPFFRPGDWKLRIEAPTEQLPGLPVTLDSFREEHVEIGDGEVGNDPGEGVLLFFSLPANIVAGVRQGTVDLALANLTVNTPRERNYLIRGPGLGPLPPIRLCADREADPRLDVIVQDEFVGSASTLLAGATRDLSFPAHPGETADGDFYVAIVSRFPPGIGVQGWSLAASVTGDLRVTGGRTVGSAGISLSEGFEAFRILDPSVIHPDTGLPQGEGFVHAVSLSFVRPVTLPPRGTETVLEVTVETNVPVLEDAPARGRVEWRDHMTIGSGDRLSPPTPNIATVLSRTVRFCTCPATDIVFSTIPDCNENGVSDDEEVAEKLAPDCNGNGIPDECDIAAVTSPDTGGDGVPDECQCTPVCQRVSSHYKTPVGVVHEAVLGPIRVTEATSGGGEPIPLVIEDCNRDGELDLAIRSSSAEALVPVVVFLGDVCAGGTLPPLVSLRLLTEDALVVGYDRFGRAVGTARASRPYREQVLTLASPDGIERLEVRAQQTCLLEVCTCCNLSASKGRFRRGDTNADSKVDLSDAVSVLAFLFLGDRAPRCLDAADSNDDGAIDVSDAVRMLGFLFLGSAEPPAPGPFVCGTDPTPSQLAPCSPDCD